MTSRQIFRTICTYLRNSVCVCFKTIYVDLHNRAIKSIYRLVTKLNYELSLYLWTKQIKVELFSSDQKYKSRTFKKLYI